MINITQKADVQEQGLWMFYRFLAVHRTTCAEATHLR